MSKEMWAQVKRFSDGDSLDAKTLNVPIGQLGDRTSYLYDRLMSLINSGSLSSVILTGVDLSTDSGKEPEIGNAVYLDRKGNDGLFSAAKATMSLYDDFMAADSAFTVGILQSKSGTKGDVVVYGRLNLSSNGSPIQVADMIESGEEFRPGRYYLSANEAGHLTAHPNGPLIYVCTIDGTVSAGAFGGTAIVTPQFLDIGTSHVHRTATLTARPAGTKSTEGYLPIDDTFTLDQKGPLALRFGGTWTADREIDYSFYLDNESGSWPNGVSLSWRENGGAPHSVPIHAPDEEVEISNGLTARLSFPASTASTAFSGLSRNQRTWETLTFPAAGKGWTDHEARAIAKSASIPGLKVSIRGNMESYATLVNVMFPRSIEILTLGSIYPGVMFEYDGKTYLFSEDVDSGSAESGETLVPVGTCLADSALNLAKALNKDVAGSRFAVLEPESDSSESSGSSPADQAWLVIMDGADRVEADGEVVVYSRYIESKGNGFDVDGVTSVNAVAFDGYGRILGADAVMADMYTRVWKTSGRISIMAYKDVAEDVFVPYGTIASATVYDDEPDAIYDYVIGMEQKISNFWPPVPPKSAALIVNGVEMDNKALLPDNPTVSFGRDTIHWFEDDAGRKPWPEALTSRDGHIDPSDDKTEVMHWVRGFQGATGPVTSIQVREGSPLRIYGYGTDVTANTGDLEIAADFDFAMENGGAPGFNVPKRARNGKLIAGPVVERIVGGPGVSVISRSGCPDGQGTVIVALDNGAYRNQFSDIALENAEQAKIGMFPYIRLKGYSGSSITSPSAFTATMRVPTNLPDGRYALKIFASVFGETGFSETFRRAACVKLSYNILPDFSTDGNMEYSDLKSSLLKPDAERNVIIPFGHVGSESATYGYNGYDPVLVTTNDSDMDSKYDVVEKRFGQNIPSSNDFAHQGITPVLRPGYLVGIRISRAVYQGSDFEPYPWAIGFINVSWALVSTDDYWRSARTPSVNPLDGVEIQANTAAGIRTAVETIGDALGATVVRR